MFVFQDSIDGICPPCVEQLPCNLGGCISQPDPHCEDPDTKYQKICLQKEPDGKFRAKCMLCGDFYHYDCNNCECKIRPGALAITIGVPSVVAFIIIAACFYWK
uniref:Uncharacterized protein n=1 Tax=Lotharella oceanica TaxID=641309 RepID=A0A7S2TLJ8_9EUKA|mmetsp:Transcript_17013/g.32294  ORF Transcript_17013/g.32294 Transcript_17013/m.32294 type:complete len:104 (+) Transcript_17013:322-633(+)